MADNEDFSTGTTAKKWACGFCTYLNWEASRKCVLCLQQRNKPMLIEELCLTSDSDNNRERVLRVRADLPLSEFTDEQLNSVTIEEGRWPCPTCTYFNCRRTKRCIHCNTDRPVQYVTPPSLSPPAQQAPWKFPQKFKESQHLISRALNKWSCLGCTYDNWPTASKCTICGQLRHTTREQSGSPTSQELNNSQIQQVKRNKTQQSRRQDSPEIRNFNQLRISNDGLTNNAAVPTRPSPHVAGQIRQNFNQLRINNDGRTTNVAVTTRTPLVAGQVRPIYTFSSPMNLSPEDAHDIGTITGNRRDSGEEDVD